jgi:hypothetical protein
MLFDEPSREPLPSDPTAEDHRAATIKAMLGSVPLVGGLLAEEIGLLIAPPLAQRRDVWFEDLARRLRDLETKVAGFHFDDLAQNEQFVSATVQATQAALRTHQREKLDALRNAVLNVAAGREANGDRQAQFIGMVNRFTETTSRCFDSLTIHRSTSSGGAFPLHRFGDLLRCGWMSLFSRACQNSALNYNRPLRIIPPQRFRFFR